MAPLRMSEVPFSDKQAPNCKRCLAHHWTQLGWHHFYLGLTIHHFLSDPHKSRIGVSSEDGSACILLQAADPKFDPPSGIAAGKGVPLPCLV